MQIKHNFTSEIPDDPAAQAAGQVTPTHWNQNHQFILEPNSLVGNSDAEVGPAQAISVGGGLALLAGALRLLGVPLFVQADEPEYLGPYLWVQLLGGGDFTLWVNDAA